MPKRKSLAEALTGKKSLVCFVTAGDPPIEYLPGIMSAIEEGGTDVIEVGLPFSDPIADGPTIQASSQRALDRGVRVEEILKTIGQAPVSVPIVLMGYTNTAMRIGFDAFASKVAEAGVAGVILSDMAPDDSEAWRRAAKANGLDTIFLAAPTSTDERLQAVAEVSSGFIYCVSRTGVTGADSEVSQLVGETVRRIRTFSDLPICVGFGISTHEHVRAVYETADGAVVGSHIVDFLFKHWDEGKGRAELINLIRSLKGPS